MVFLTVDVYNFNVTYFKENNIIAMIERSVIRLCKDLGCCDACCVRYLGLKNPSLYENVHQFVQKVCKHIYFIFKFV